MSATASTADFAQCLVLMDDQDARKALVAKNEAAAILAAAQLNFSAVADQIEQRRLLLPANIVAAIKRMDLPHEGDAAFRGACRLLAHAKLGFRHIAEALDNAAVSHAEHQAVTAELAHLTSLYQAERRKVLQLKIALGFSDLLTAVRHHWGGLAWFLVFASLTAFVSITGATLVNIGRSFVEYAAASLPKPSEARPAAKAVVSPSCSSSELVMDAGRTPVASTQGLEASQRVHREPQTLGPSPQPSARQRSFDDHVPPTSWRCHNGTGWCW
jgi:hypothetical protein